MCRLFAAVLPNAHVLSQPSFTCTHLTCTHHTPQLSIGNTHTAACAHRVETAKSGRSKCVQTGTARKCGDKGEKKGDFIPKGEVRIGVINVETGTCVKFFAMSSSQTSLLFFNSSTVLLHSFVPSHSLALSCALLTVSRIGILFSLFKKVRINVLALRSVTSAFGSWGEFCFF